MGRTRLTRTFPEILATALVGGIDVSLGVAALLVVEHETGSRLLGALAFTIGFIALILGKPSCSTRTISSPSQPWWLTRPASRHYCGYGSERPR